MAERDHKFQAIVRRGITEAKSREDITVETKDVVNSVRRNLGDSASSEIFQELLLNTAQAVYNPAAAAIIRNVLDIDGHTKVKFTRDALDTLYQVYSVLDREPGTTASEQGEVRLDHNALLTTSFTQFRTIPQLQFF